MDVSELLNIISKGENLTVEFKQKFTEHEKIAKEMIAFANTKGGLLIFGVRDNRKILGIESEKEIAELVKETAEHYSVPPIKYKIEFPEIKKKMLGVVYIEPSDEKPHRIEDYKGKLDLNSAQVYVRVNDKSVLAGKEMIKLMMINPENKTLKNYEFASNEKAVFTYLETHETIDAKTLSKFANISMRRASRTLINLVRLNLLFIHTKDNGENYFTAK
jgi:predicted HTH transcriptional regulator